MILRNVMLRICILAVALAALLAGDAGAAVLPAPESQRLFVEGNELFHQANDLVKKDPDAAKDLYVKAAMRFERIVQEGGIHNGKLYYNIGNAYFRTEDIGRAILNYRRAGLLTPGDVNLRQNLAYARSKRLDRIEERQKTKVLKTLFFWHYDLSAATRTVLFSAFFVCLWLLASARLFAKKAFVSWAIVVCVLLAAMLFGSLAAEAAANAREASGVVLAAEVVARKGDGETYQPSFKEPLHAGTEFDVLEERGDWFHIELPDGRRCWLPAGSVGKVQWE